MFFKENVFFILCFTHLIDSGPTEPGAVATTEKTRRILRGVEVHDTRPYMVYLRPAPPADNQAAPDPNWLCGGAIIHDRYILTSAACIEDVKHFYVISGTNKWLPMSEENDCIKNGAKKAVWKCVPKDYVYDGDEFDNIRWMSGDLAVVKVEDNFNFERRVKGCDFVPQKIPFNNRSIELEKSGTVASTAGWGSKKQYTNVRHFFDDDPIGTMITMPDFPPQTIQKFQMRSDSVNSPTLMETEVVLISKKNCKKRWEPRYHSIIEENMVCAKDGHDLEDTVCSEREVDCKELAYSDQDYDGPEESRRLMVDPKILDVHSSGHFNSNHSYRRYKVESGGFCENDHGGPLVHGQGKSAIIIGVISACLTRNITKKCYGPFLYTSVFKYRNVITCAIDKDIYGDNTCKILLRTLKTRLKETTFVWDHYLSARQGLEKSPSKTGKNLYHVESDPNDLTLLLLKSRPIRGNISSKLQFPQLWRSRTEDQTVKNVRNSSITVPSTTPQHKFKQLWSGVDFHL